MRFKIFEFDSVKNERLGFVGKAPDIATARKIAKKTASQWCEDETPSLYKRGMGTDPNAHHELFLGLSDFGALIEFEAKSQAS